MNDKVGKLPKITSKDQAFKEIRRIANDDRSHVMLVDQVGWLDLKMKTISTIAQRGLALKEKK